VEARRAVRFGAELAAREIFSRTFMVAYVSCDARPRAQMWRAAVIHGCPH
jgi:hypothetical protein